MVLDCGFRGNGRRLGAMNHAPAKTYLCQPYGSPAARRTGVACCASTAVGLARKGEAWVLRQLDCGFRRNDGLGRAEGRDGPGWAWG